MKKILYLSMALAVAVGVAFSLVALSQSDDVDEKTNKKKVRVMEVEKTAMKEIQEFSGIVQGYQETELAPKISGRLIQVIPKEGDSVVKGQLLAMVDGSDLLAQEDLSREQVESAKKSVDKTEDYYDQLVEESEEHLELAEDAYEEARGSSNESEISSTKASVKKAEEAVESAEEMKDMQKQITKNQQNIAEKQLSASIIMAENRKIYAPYSGVVTKKYLDVGAIVSPQVPVIAFAKSEKREINISVPGSLIKSLSAGGRVKIKNPRGGIFEGKIESISPVSDSVSRKSRIKIVFNEEHDLMLGDFVYAELVINEKKSVVSVPLSAVKKEYHENFVFVFKEDGVAQKRKVNLGVIHDGDVEILEGVKAGEKVITEGQTYLKNNELIETYE